MSNDIKIDNIKDINDYRDQYENSIEKLQKQQLSVFGIILKVKEFLPMSS